MTWSEEGQEVEGRKEQMRAGKAPASGSSLRPWRRNGSDELEANGVWTIACWKPSSGVKGGRWYSLRKGCDPQHLWRGAWQVIRNDGAAGWTTELRATGKELKRRWTAGARLREGTYQPSRLSGVWIEKPAAGEAPLGITRCVTAWCRRRC